MKGILLNSNLIIMNLKNNTLNNILIYIFELVIIGLIILKQVFFLEISHNIISIIILLLFLLLKREFKYSLLVFLIPFSNTINIFYAVILYAFFEIIDMIINKKKMSRIIALLFIMIAYELLHILIPPFSIISWITFSSSVFIIFTFLLDEKQENNGNAIFSFVFGCLVYFIILMLCTFDRIPIANFINDGLRLGGDNHLLQDLTFSNGYSILNNSNYLGMLCNINIIILLMSLNISNFYKRTTSYFLIIFFIFCGILTLSRTFIVTLILSFVIIAYFVFKTSKKNLTSLIKKFFFLFMVLCFVFLVFQNTIDNVLSRFSFDEIFFGSRNEIIEEYNQVIFSDVKILLFGVGAQSISLKVGLNLSPHNFIQELFVSWGLIGFVIFLLFLTICFKYVLGKSKKYYNIIPIFILLISCLSSRIISRYDLFLIISMLLFFSKTTFIKQLGKTYD